MAGPVNLPMSALESSVYYSMLSLIDPSMPANSGTFRPVGISAPAGSIVNPRSPAAVSYRSDTAQRVVDVIFGALASITPDRVVAACHSTISHIQISGVNPGDDRFYIYADTIGGGGGASQFGDGMNGIQVHTSNTPNTPIEAIESEFPLRFENYSLIERSGGNGQHLGGMGLRRDIKILGPSATITCKGDRHKTRPWGLAGGAPGAAGRYIINPGSDHEVVLPSKTLGYILRAGDVVSIQTPGGGGYGPPKSLV
jgi:N-methylhydantoinase B